MFKVGDCIFNEIWSMLIINKNFILKVNSNTYTIGFNRTLFRNLQHNSKFNKLWHHLR